MRALAARSADAAAEIKSLIEESGYQIENGVDLFQETGTALKAILDSVGSLTGHVRTIATSSLEQADCLHGINQTISDIDAATQANMSLLTRSTEAGAELLTRSASLAESLQRFRIPTGPQDAERAPPPLRQSA